MPHVTLKMFSGRTEEQKQAVTQALADALKSALGSKDESISIAIEEYAKEDWNEKVFKPEIEGKSATLYKKPGQ